MLNIVPARLGICRRSFIWTLICMCRDIGRHKSGSCTQFTESHRVEGNCKLHSCNVRKLEMETAYCRCQPASDCFSCCAIHVGLQRDVCPPRECLSFHPRLRAKTAYESSGAFSQAILASIWDHQKRYHVLHSSHLSASRRDRLIDSKVSKQALAASSLEASCWISNLFGRFESYQEAYYPA